MRLDFCVACGERDFQLLEHHHLVPRCEAGTDDDTNLLTLCNTCHGKTHGMVRREIGKLITAGLERARANGTRLGPPLLSKKKTAAVLAHLKAGVGICKTARLVGCGVSAVQRIKREGG